VANTFFQFKKFIVHQEHTAMKVCTDACLFGAWMAEDDIIKQASSILDIGTGTGLLSLMIAQATISNENDIKITAVENESGAAMEAESNFKLIPWSSNLKIINSAIQDYDTDTFDCIISNPPFFEGDLQSISENKNLAAHSIALPWTTLINEVDRLLKPNGHYFVMVPALRAYTMQKLATEKGMQLLEEVMVYNADKQKPFRALQKFIKLDKVTCEIKRTNFIIKDVDNNYTQSFKNLLSPYYLHL
jgi:tRNA1Val (adenine37-N6)-methyltransferase